MSEKLPQHVGIIMDGNRRWARSRGLPTLEGHRRGYNKLKEVGEWLLTRGVTYLTVYAFSTENWNRSKEEVSYLMDLLHTALTKEVDEFNRRGIHLRVIGSREGLPENVRRAANEAEVRTAGNTRGLTQLAINYGGRQEIVDMAKTAIQKGLAADDLTIERLGQFTYAPDVPDPDLIIRTSGEQRLSGFLAWESVYSELYFTPVPWPAFSETDLDAALSWYARRERRLGS